jgi:hypothetical protein
MLVDLIVALKYLKDGLLDFAGVSLIGVVEFELIQD